MSLHDGLVAYWKLDEASGTRVDATGRGNDLTDNNTVTQAAGKVSDAAQFTAANLEYLSRATNADLEMGDIDFTICAWAYLDSLVNSQIVAKDTDSPSNSRDYTLDYFQAGPTQFRFYFVNGGQVKIATTTTETVTMSTWYFLVGWHDATADTVNIQLDNGTPHSAPTGGLAPQVSAAEFRIGARPYTGFEDYMNGRIDEVGIWKRVLTGNERNQLYKSGAGFSYPFLYPSFRVNKIRPAFFKPGLAR